MKRFVATFITVMLMEQVIRAFHLGPRFAIGLMVASACVLVALWIFTRSTRSTR